jgi:hypothetical protein
MIALDRLMTRRAAPNSNRSRPAPRYGAPVRFSRRPWFRLDEHARERHAELLITCSRRAPRHLRARHA